MKERPTRKDSKPRKPVPPDLPPGISETDDPLEVQEYGHSIDGAIAERICRLIEQNPRGLDTICESVSGLCSARQFHRWLDFSEPLRQRYARAKDRQAELLAYQVVEISDTPHEGTKTKTTDKGEEVITGDMVEHRRLQMDARKWLAGKLNPKKWGQKLDVTSDGKPLEPTTVVREVIHRQA